MTGTATLPRSAVAAAPRALPGWVWVGLVALLALAALVASLLLSGWLFPTFSANNDEPGYAYQARLLLDGSLTLPADVYEPFFRPWISGRIADRLVPVFPPVWPAVLAVSELLSGSMRPAAALTAAAAVVLVVLFAREVTGDRWLAVLAGALVLASPFFLVQTATLLAYPFAVVLQLAFAVCLLRAARTGRAGWALAAGVLVGLAAFARSYDAVLFALPVGVAVLVSLARDRQRLLRTVAWGLAGALPVLAAILAYNVATTGEPLRFALQAAAPGNQFGFGPRSIVVGAPLVQYDLAEAVRTSTLTVLALPGWTFGGLLVVPLAILGWALLTRRAAWLLLALVAVFPVGYFFWWGNALATMGVALFGPQYYLPALAPLAVLVAAGLADVWRRRRTAAVLIACALLAATLVRLPERIALNAGFRDDHAGELAAVDAAVDGPAVVLIPSERDGPWIGHPRPHLLNDVDLADPVIYAADSGAANLVLPERFPDRALYRLEPRAGGPVVVPVEAVTGPELAVRTTVTNTTGQRVVSVYATDGQRTDRWILDQDSRLGATYAVDWLLEPGGLRPATAGPVAAEPVVAEDDLELGAGGSLAIGVAQGPTPDLATAAVAEQRTAARVDGGQVAVLAPGSPWRAPSPSGPWTAEPVDDALGLTVAPVP